MLTKIADRWYIDFSFISYIHTHEENILISFKCTTTTAIILTEDEDKEIFLKKLDEYLLDQNKPKQQPATRFSGFIKEDPLSVYTGPCPD